MTACTVTMSVPTTVEAIRAATPPGQIAMFRVSSMSASCGADDWILGEHVYVSRKGNVFDFISEQKQGHVSEFGLHFVSYIDASNARR
jgi:hypothetical protein